MPGSLFGASWYKVAGLRPRLLTHLRIVRQPSRDQIWQVLVDPSSGAQVRLNPVAWGFAGRCDGRRTVDEIWQGLLAGQGNEAPVQDEVLALLARLHQAGMVQFDAAPSLAMLFERRDAARRQRVRSWINPFALRLRLADPSRWLDRLMPLAPWLFRGPALLVWMVVVALAAIAAGINHDALTAHGTQLMGSPRAWLLLWLIYPLVKALHEAGHGLAVRHHGGQVNSCGLTLLFFTPAPFVDASAANAFSRPRDRAVVSAAGIQMELFLASIGLGVWLAVEPGWLRDAAFIVFTIGSVSTVLFNANPLMRLDGYYLLSDLLDLPNLAPRSQALWSRLWRRLLLGAELAPLPRLAHGELKWLIAYAPLSWLYRAVLMMSLVTWIGAKSWLLGWILALLALTWLVFQPLAVAVNFLRTLPAVRERRRAAGLSAAALAAVLAGLFVVPAPDTTLARGVVWPPERAQLRTTAAGVLAEASAVDGQSVQAGDPVLRLDDPELLASRQQRASQLAGLQAQQYQVLLTEPLKATQLAEEISRSQAEIRRADEQLAELQLNAPVSGRVVLPHAADQAGTWQARGTMLGFVLAPDAPMNVRVVLPQQEVVQVRERLRAAEVRPAAVDAKAMPASLTHDFTAASRQLPSQALSERYGGPVAMDASDRDGLRTAEPVVWLDLSVPGAHAGLVGQRVWVRFELSAQPLGIQWARRMRLLLLRHFNPVGQA